MNKKVILGLITVIVFIVLVYTFVHIKQNNKNKENNKVDNIVQNENINRTIIHIDVNKIEDKREFEGLDGEIF